MRLLAAALAQLTALATASCTCHHQGSPPEYEYYDPLMVDASTVDDLHRHRKKAACRVGDDRPEVMLQLCRDKGFDGVAFAPHIVSVALIKRADQLGLAVVSAPAGTEGSRTTSGS